MDPILPTLLLLSNLSFNGVSGTNQAVNQPQLLAEHTMSLENRYPVESVNSVFKDNILLNMEYLREDIKKGDTVDWEKTRKPFHYSFTLEPGKTFAYHNIVLDQYSGKVVKTTNAHFGASEGFVSDGYLVGDGVCHLASLINWVSKDAQLDSNAPTNHDFANIPDVPKEYGTSIYSSGSASDASQNLYVTNNQDETVEFDFDFDGKNLKLSEYKLVNNSN